VGSSGWSAEDAQTRAALGRELNTNALREMGLAVRNAELERNRWMAFTIVELEWISGIADPAAPRRHERDSLPEQANAELERRARASAGTENDAT
jgi:hypothetical protein